MSIHNIFLDEKYIESKKGGKDQKSIQSSTTPDPGYHMGNLQFEYLSFLSNNSKFTFSF